MRPDFGQLPDLESKGRYIYYYLVDMMDDRWGISHPTPDRLDRLSEGRVIVLTVDQVSSKDESF